MSAAAGPARAQPQDPMPVTVAVLGAGIVGRTLAAGWARAGHDVLLGSRDPHSTRIADEIADVRESSGSRTRLEAARHVDAAAAADVVVITVTGGQVADLVSELGPALAGKPAIDTTNDLTPGAASLNALDVLAEAGAAPYRAFNTTGWEQMLRPDFGALTCDMLYTGGDSHAPVVSRLISDIGFRPVHLGGSARAVTALDNLAALWFLLAYERGYGRRLGFRILTDSDDLRSEDS